MRHIRWIFLLLFFCVNSILHAQNLSALDENNGFQNYKFGMHQDSISNCSYVSTAFDMYGQNVTTDSRGNDVEHCDSSDTLFINGIEVFMMRLYFIDSKLSKIRLTFQESRQVTTALYSAFGDPTSTNKSDPNRNFYLVKYEGDKVILTYEYGGRSLPTVEFKISNFDEKLQEFQSKKYTPSDW